MIKILINDADTVFKNGLRRVLEGEKEFEVIARSGAGSGMIKSILMNMPDVIILGSNFDGVKIAREIFRNYRLAKIILFSSRIDGEYISEAMRRGIKGYCNRSCSIPEMVNGIRKVINGDTFFCESAKSEFDKYSIELLNRKKSTMIESPFPERYNVYS